MAKKNQNVIQALGKIAEDIDNVSLNDSDAWHGLGQELEGVLRSVPKKNESLRDLLQLTLRCFEIMGEQATTEPLSFLDAVSQGLNAAEHCFLDQPDSEKGVDESRQNLERVLSTAEATDKGASSDPEGESGYTAIESLDDAAAFLIQLEPENHAELLGLRHSLLGLSENSEYSDQCRKLLVQISEKIDQIVKGGAADAGQTLSEVGFLLEEAMNPNETVGDGLEATQAEVSDTDAGNWTAECGGQVDFMPQDADEELVAEFIAEGSDLIEKAEEALLSLETNPGDMESVGTVFRAFHTVKGTAAFLELDLISELGHHAESLLSRVRDGEIRYSGGYADLSLRALDMIKELLAGVQAALSGDPLLKPESYDELVKLLANPEAAGISEDVDDVSTPRVGDMLVAQGKIERDQLEEAVDSHPQEKLGVAVVKSKAATVKDVGQALRAQTRIKNSRQVVETSVRVSTQGLDRLIDMVGELVIAHSMIAQDNLVSNGDHHELNKKVAHTSKIVRELQDVSMSMRMVPLKATFNKMARLVRDVSRKVGKNVNFVTEGEDTEIDRNLVNIINDPLVHMIRNAVDHGIETPEERRHKGKPEVGEVQLLAYHSAGAVVVEIRDDGQGLDRDIILTKAKEKGMIGDSAEINDRSFSDREVFNMILEPGFSTAQVVTDVSGRGVGMDVVKKNIESLRGQVEIRSEYGQGSVFKMSLPLTLAIIDGMVVRVGSETYVIPTVSIIRSLKLDPSEMTTVLNQGEMLTLQDGLTPLYRMARLYDIKDDKDDSEDTIIVVVEDEERRAGLLVDELVSRQQVVIKSLGESMKDIPGISGGAIMPDGRVGLIIDVGGLVKFATNGQANGHREEVGTSADQNLAA
ncbi:MAG: chemotaxis protein CheA [Desulfobacterales bacterium]|nr:chemotaxis protein CheA [Desulfobacterales bacterium]